MVWGTKDVDQAENKRIVGAAWEEKHNTLQRASTSSNQYVYLNETVIEMCANFSHEGFAWSDFAVFVFHCFMNFPIQHQLFYIALYPEIPKNSISLPNHGLPHTLNYNPHYVINTISLRKMHFTKRKSLTNPFQISPGFLPVYRGKRHPWLQAISFPNLYLP
jgi:hypothetical protein